MKALSIRQPWAWLILFAGKRVENRVWNTKFRGEFLIHAAKGMTAAEYEDAVYFARGLGVDPEEIPLPTALPRGCIVGRARLVDVLLPSADGIPRAPWHMADQYGFVLADIDPMILRKPCRGKLGFFEVPPEVLK